MQVYRIVSEESGLGLFYSGQTEASKFAREHSITNPGNVYRVYEFKTGKTLMDKKTAILALNEEEWCEPTLKAEFVDGRPCKVA